MAADAKLKKFDASSIDADADYVVTEPLAVADNLWVHSKVYPSGGENSLHKHPLEDHIFFVVSGEAMFYDAEDELVRLGPSSGVLIPKGVAYRFHSSGDEPLVALRIGGAPRDASDASIDAAFPAPMAVRTRPDGTPFPGDDPDNVKGARVR
jgi:mannose-6-phosphate isomerase-like protein (cupin superfamily)